MLFGIQILNTFYIIYKTILENDCRRYNMIRNKISEHACLYLQFFHKYLIKNIIPCLNLPFGKNILLHKHLYTFGSYILLKGHRSRENSFKTSSFSLFMPGGTISVPLKHYCFRFNNKFAYHLHHGLILTQPPL